MINILSLWSIYDAKCTFMFTGSSRKTERMKHAIKSTWKGKELSKAAGLCNGLQGRVAGIAMRDKVLQSNARNKPYR